MHIRLTLNWGLNFGPRQLKRKENVRISFQKPDGVKPNENRKVEIRPGYEHINVHMIFDIRMDGKFTRN